MNNSLPAYTAGKRITGLQGCSIIPAWIILAAYAFGGLIPTLGIVGAAAALS